MDKMSILLKLSGTKNDKEWNDVCDEVKKYTKTLPESERSGDYPAWWFHAVIMSGMLNIVSSKWEE